MRARALGKSDLPGFDDRATELILEMISTGWIGYVSNKGHAIMYAPDRRATISVSRSSKRGRSGRNAEAAYRRWEKRRDARETV